jgi:ATP-dependent Zn protease
MKGHTNNPYGRPKGSSNKITTEVRECVSKLIEEEVPRLKEALDEVRKESPARYVELVTKLLPYVAPKLASITTVDETDSLQTNLPTWFDEVDDAEND